MSRGHARRLGIGFSIPEKDPLTVPDCAAALKVPNSAIYEAIQEGRIGAITIHRMESDREEYRIPLSNFIEYLNSRFGDALYFTFPESDRLTLTRTAQALGCSHEHVRRLVSDGEFPRAFNQARPGRKKHWIIPIVDLVDYVNRNRYGAYS